MIWFFYEVMVIDDSGVVNVVFVSEIVIIMIIGINDVLIVIVDIVIVIV